MFSADEIREHLAGLEYRKGWSWTLESDPWEGLYVRFLGEVQDSYGTGTITLGIDSWLPPIETRSQLDLWMQWRLWRIEGHEAREYLRREGRPLFDPHGAER